MADAYISGLAAAEALTGDELIEVSQLSSTITITASTISALASDNSYNDSGSGFVDAGFAVDDRVRVTGFTGDVANNILVGTITALTAGKMTIGGTDGDVIVDDAAGESVTISKWVTRRTTVDDVASGSGGSPLTQGKHTIPILAGSMTARTTSGAASGTTETTTNDVMLRTLDFDAATDEFAQIMVPMPKSWDEGTLTARFRWTAENTGDVVWGIQAVAISNDDVLDAAFGTAVTVTDSVTAAGDLMVSAETGAITIGGTLAEGDMVVIQVYRDANAGGDTCAVDAKLIGIDLFVTYDAGNDA